MRRLFLLGFSLMLLINLTARELSLENCLDAAMGNNLELKSAKLDLENRADEHSKSLYNFLPSGNIYAKANYDDNKNQIGTVGISVSGSYYLFDDRIAQSRLSKINYKSQEIYYQLSKYNILTKVISLYSEVLHLEKSLELYQNSAEFYSSEEVFIKELLKVGQRNELDLYSAQIELQDAHLKLSQTKNSLRKKKLELGIEIGYEIGEGAHFIIPEQAYKIVSEKSVSEKSVSETSGLETSVSDNSMENNPDLRIEAYNLKQSEINKFSSWKNILPQLYVSGTYSKEQLEYWKDNDLTYNNDGTFIDRSSIQEYWQASINASFSFGDIIQRLKKNAINKRNLRKQMYQMDITTKRISNELEAQKLDLELKREEILIVTKKLELARKKFQLSQERFRRGLISFLDYKTSMNEKITASLELMNSRNTYLLILTKWQQLNGQKILGKY